jgi:hypothetical protein
MSLKESAEDLASAVINKVLGDDIFSQLKSEHRELQSTLKKAEEASPGQRKTYLTRIERLLVPHARGEEKTLYAVLHERLKNLSDQGREPAKASEEAMDLTNEAYEEHHAADLLMGELKNTPIESETWLARLTVIRENLDHHIKEEEEQLFSKARQLLTLEEQKEILEAYLHCKAQFAESLPLQTQISAKVPSPEVAKMV